ncbi:MAG TPA: DsbA family protein [Acidimicrobiales bacterium]
MSVAVEFWFDPTCPYTWRTSRWARELERAGAVTIEWKVMSLALLNEGRDLPEQHLEGFVRGTRFLRALVAAGERGGSDAVGRLYDALGTHLHEEGEDLADDVLIRSVEEVGLDGAVADAAEDEARDDAVRASHDEAQDRVGEETGSPVTAYDGGLAFFGPVVVPTPTADEASTLLTAMTSLSKVSAFSEAKRSRNRF